MSLFYCFIIKKDIKRCIKISKIKFVYKTTLLVE